MIVKVTNPSKQRFAAFWSLVDPVKVATDQFDAYCPGGCQRRKRRLSLRYDSENRRAVVFDHGGCTFRDILAGGGISPCDLRDIDASDLVDRPIRAESLRPSITRRDFLRLTRPCNLRRHAEQLGVSVSSLLRLGARRHINGDALAFPMFSTRGVIGVKLRLDDGTKINIRGSRNGLHIPEGLKLDRRLFICEGPTDCAAVLTTGLNCVGLPCNCASWDLLERFIKRNGIKSVVVIRDNDSAGDAFHRLGERIGAPVIAPPKRFKDVRAWLGWSGRSAVRKQLLKG